MKDKKATWLDTLIDLSDSVWGSAIRVTVVLAGVFGALFILYAPACGCTTKEHAYRANMKGDLRNLVMAQEVYYADSGSYALTLSALETVYQPSAPVSVVLDVAAPDGWSASARHTGTSAVCVVFIGEDMNRPSSPDAEEGAPYCRDD